MDTRAMLLGLCLMGFLWVVASEAMDPARWLAPPIQWGR